MILQTHPNTQIFVHTGFGERERERERAGGWREKHRPGSGCITKAIKLSFQLMAVKIPYLFPLGSVQPHRWWFFRVERRVFIGDARSSVPRSGTGRQWLTSIEVELIFGDQMTFISVGHVWKYMEIWYNYADLWPPSKMMRSRWKLPSTAARRSNFATRGLAGCCTSFNIAQRGASKGETYGCHPESPCCQESNPAIYTALSWTERKAHNMYTVYINTHKCIYIHTQYMIWFYLMYIHIIMYDVFTYDICIYSIHLWLHSNRQVACLSVDLFLVSVHA